MKKGTRDWYKDAKTQYDSITLLCVFTWEGATNTAKENFPNTNIESTFHIQGN